MTDRPPLPNPVRAEPTLPAGLVLTLHLIATTLVAVFGGGALSGLLCLHGLAVPGRHHIGSTLLHLSKHWADPAAAWPADPRPGPGWLTWSCIAIVAIGWSVAVILLSSELDTRWRRHHRRRPGLATRDDLRRAGVDKRSAAAKAAVEFPEQTRRHTPPRRRWWRR